jgi:uncharacterized protein YndB with AHSA1/START domain
MTTTPFSHGMFTLKRAWAAPAERVFSAWSDPQLKAQWFSGPPDVWTLVHRSLDFRVGGTEVLEGRLTDGGMTTLYQARFHLIEPNRRLVYTYDLHLGGNFHSVTLSSLILEPGPDRTHVAYTEQILFLDGRDGTADRQGGTELQFSNIEKALQLDGGAQ